MEREMSGSTTSDQPLTIIVNLRADKVMVARDGKRMTDTDSLAYYLDKAEPSG